MNFFKPIFLLLWIYFSVNAVIIHICPRNRFFFELKPQQCYANTLEKKLFIKLNIEETNTHDLVLKFWLNNYEKLKGKKFTILHIDSHADIDIVSEMNKKNILTSSWYKLKKYYGITISNFMSPMLYMGLVERVIWLTTKEDFNNDQFVIGNLKNSNLVKTNSSNLFIGDDRRLRIEEQFGNIQNHMEFVVMKIEDLKKLNFTLEPSKTLLDIDYDYFSTSSPLVDALVKRFKNKAQVKNVVSIFNDEKYCTSKMKHLSTNEKSIIDVLQIPTFQNSKEQNDDFLINRILFSLLYQCFHGKKKRWKDFVKCTKIPTKLWCKGEEDALRKQKLFKKYMDYMIEEEEEDEEEDIDDLLFEASSASCLREFSNSLQNIRKDKNELKQFLNQIGLKSPPAFISLAQSVNCGHTPKHLVEFIKYEIYQLLDELYIDNITIVKKNE
eukprot:gene9436-1642_t